MQQLLLRPQLFLNASPQAGKGFLSELLLLLLILLLRQQLPNLPYIHACNHVYIKALLHT